MQQTYLMTSQQTGLQYHKNLEANSIWKWFHVSNSNSDHGTGSDILMIFIIGCCKYSKRVQNMPPNFPKCDI